MPVVGIHGFYIQLSIQYRACATTVARGTGSKLRTGHGDVITAHARDKHQFIVNAQDAQAAGLVEFRKRGIHNGHGRGAAVDVAIQHAGKVVYQKPPLWIDIRAIIHADVILPLGGILA